MLVPFSYEPLPERLQSLKISRALWRVKLPGFNLIVGDDRGEFPPIIGDKGECSVILEYDYDSRRFVANGAAEGDSAARSGIEESL